MESTDDTAADNREKKEKIAGLSTVVDPEALEMLEAELIHQGILPAFPEPSQLHPTPTRLSQRVAHEINLLKWHARRAGHGSRSIQFEVNLPAYITHVVEDLRGMVIQLEQHTEAHIAEEFAQLHQVPTSQAQCQAELEMLKRFSDFLSGKFELTANQYQRGLNTVLRSLSRRKSQQVDEAEVTTKPLSPEKSEQIDSDSILITLPISQREFHNALKIS